MRTKILYHNLSVPGETLCFGRKLVPEGGGLALILSDETDLREEQADEKLAQAGIVITLAGSLGWEEARRLCIMGEGERSLEDLSLPEQMREKSALAAVWFYLSMREEPGSGEELMDLHNGLLALMGAEEENAQLAAALGEKGTRAFYNAIQGIRSRLEDAEDYCDTESLCAAVDYPAVRRIFLQNWKSGLERNT